MTWAEVCEDKTLSDLPYKIELDRWGNIVMSPAKSRHSEFQGQILVKLQSLKSGGIAIPECPLETSEGTKAIDVAWISFDRRKSKPRDPSYLIAPEICVEVLSPSNPPGEIEERKRLFFERGAEECWVCDNDGKISFFDVAGNLERSKLCPEFPEKILI